jgi:hypothetical protein
LEPPYAENRTYGGMRVDGVKRPSLYFN